MARLAKIEPRKVAADTAAPATASSLPYVLPFAVFLGFLALFSSVFHGAPFISFTADEALRDLTLVAVLAVVSRRVIDFRVHHALGTVLLGVAIFALWIAPDLLSQTYRHGWLFENFITGKAQSSFPSAARHNPLMIALRAFRAAVIVPIVEELFWRGWLLRWMIKQDFWQVAPGTYTASSFWVVALLFASEHGPYWDVGLAAGILFNAWMIRTKSLGDLILAHAIANACLSGYLIAAGKWEYW